MFYIRADGNNQTGAGHVMRMLSVAEELMLSVKVSFLCRDAEAKALVRGRGFACDERFAKEAGASFSVTEAGAIAALLSSEDRLLVDSYLVTNEYLSILRKKCRVICMDDTMERPLLADVIVNYNLYANKNAYRTLYQKNGIPEVQYPRLLLGGSYMPVRREFRGKHIAIKDRVTNVLLTAGGSDEFHLTEEVLAALLSENKKNGAFQDVSFHIICGAYYKGYDTLVRKYADRRGLLFYRNVANMAELMQKCDVAVSAGGGTCNELCAMGIPFVAFSYAENQVRAVRALEDMGCTLNAGTLNRAEATDAAARGVLAERIVKKLGELAADRALREYLSGNGRSVVSGNGAEHLAHALL